MRLHQKLRQEAEELIKKAQAIQDKADTAVLKLTAEQEDAINACLTDADEKIVEANRREGIDQRAADMAARKQAPEVQVITVDDARGMGASMPGVARDEKEEMKFGFPTAGHFFQACITAKLDPLKPPDGRLLKMQEIIAAMAVTGGSQGVPSDGGFTVPPSFATTIWDGLNEDIFDLMSRTDQFTITGESLSFPANAETSRTSGTIFGGVQASWLAEAAQIAATKPTFRRIKLEPQELAVLIYETDKLLRNNVVALEQYLTRAATAGIQWQVGDAIVNGDGSGKPLGLLSSGSIISVAKESGQAADTIVYNNIVKMYARLHAARRRNAIWLINQDIEPQLWNLAQEGTSSSTPAFLPAGGLSAAPFATLIGRPIIPIEWCATLGDVGDIILVDLSAYAMGLRGGVAGGIMTASSPHLRFDFAETAFRFIFEADGKPWLLSALTPANGPNTLSTHVTLAARA